MPETLLKEPWRLALFFVAIFGALILCLGVILWQQNVINDHRAVESRETQRTQHLILIAIEKIDRNNQTGWKSYQAGEKARRELIRMVAEEKRLNIGILKMQRDNEKMNREQLRMGRGILRMLRRRRH